MISLIMTILCSTTIALMLKINDQKAGDSIQLLMGNYLTASLISAFFVIQQGNYNISLFTVLFGSVMGFMFVLSFFLFAQSVSFAGVALSTVTARMSVILPISLSILFFNEKPGFIKILGIILALATIVIFYFSIRNNHRSGIKDKKYLYLLLLMLGMGLGDFGMKIFQSQNYASENNIYLFIIFFTAFIYTGIWFIINKKSFESKTFFRGFALGVPNIFSSFFLLAALSQIEAVIVYPFTNISVILITTLLAIIFWKEKINTIGIIGLIAGSTAIILLGIN